MDKQNCIGSDEWRNNIIKYNVDCVYNEWDGSVLDLYIKDEGETKLPKAMGLSFRKAIIVLSGDDTIEYTDARKDFVYAGGCSDEKLKYWNCFSIYHSLKDTEGFVAQCICGHILIKYNCFIMRKSDKKVIVVGSDCVYKYLDRNKTCGNCFKQIPGTYDDDKGFTICDNCMDLTNYEQSLVDRINIMKKRFDGEAQEHWVNHITTTHNMWYTNRPLYWEYVSMVKYEELEALNIRPKAKHTQNVTGFAATNQKFSESELLKVAQACDTYYSQLQWTSDLKSFYELPEDDQRSSTPTQYIYSGIINCGKHKGDSYKYVKTNDKSYSNWVLENISYGGLLEFKNWLLANK